MAKHLLFQDGRLYAMANEDAKADFFVKFSTTVTAKTVNDEEYKSVGVKTKIATLERDSGFSSSGGVADVPQESLMLTGDENIVNIDFSVFWVIKDAGNFLFKIQDPEGTVKAASETAMREVIARSDIQPILTEGRSKIEIDTQQIIQDILDEYQSGIQITQVQTQKADPPDQVIDAFRDVQAARADMERSKNEAEAYANDVIPRARGEAQKILQAAEAYKKEVVAKVKLSETLNKNPDTILFSKG